MSIVKKSKSIIEHEDGELSDSEDHNDFDIRFVFRYITYHFKGSQNAFEVIEFNYNKLYSDIHGMSGGIREEDYNTLRNQYGPCTMNVIVNTWYRILFEEILNLFYIFQSFCILIWMLNGYYRSSIIIFSMIMTSIVAELYSTMRSLKRLREMAYYECLVQVKRNDLNGNPVVYQIKSDELVPGDVFIVPDGKKLPCDAILLSGECIVNEAMLTGESIPSVKTALPNTRFEEVKAFSIENKTETKYFLFSGTEVVQTKKWDPIGCLALVCKTSFSTSKGNLIRSIIYSAPKRFNFYGDTYKVIIVMMSLASIALATVLPVFIKYYSPYHIVVRILNPFTLSIPAGLPICMTVGVLVAITRLFLQNIYCTSPLKVNAAGRVSVVVFDKTGTLTNEGLNVLGYKIAEKKIFMNSVEKSDKIIDEMDYIRDPSQYPCDDPKVKFIECMSCCHSCVLINESIIGEPLETEMFKSTEWKITENIAANNIINSDITMFVSPNSVNCEVDCKNKGECYKLGIVKRYDFSSELQRMSVVVKNYLDGRVVLFSKGSPEQMYELFNKNTVPEEYNSVLQSYTHFGLRVIALGYRELNIELSEINNNIERSDIETEITFLGFLVFENKLKEGTAQSIADLKHGGMKCTMATGDNILTAATVAKKCGIIQNSSSILIDISNNGNDLKFEYFDHERTTSISIKVDESNSDTDEDDPEAQLVSNRKSKSVKNQRSNRISNRDEQQIVNLSGEEALNCDDDTEFCITGKAMKLLIQAKNQNIQINEVNGAQLWNKVLKQGVVYSRMSPKQKAMLIEELQLMYKTMICMCGDGANDCTALKTADVGLSLSNTEASIAAPFTSSVSNISSVCTLLKQGRASLDLSYTLFRFIIVFSCIQFTSMIICHYSLTNMDDIEFAYINICIVSPILLIYCFEDSNQSLEPKIPFKTILNKSMILSIIGHVTINVIAQAFFYLYSQDREFFIHNEKDSHLRKDTYESTIIFLFSAPQYIVIGILFNLFTPFRTRFYQNVLFMTVVVIQLLASYTMIISDWEDLRDFLNYKDIKTSYKFVLAGCTVANAFCNLIFELFIVYIFKDCKELEVREDHLKSE